MPTTPPPPGGLPPYPGPPPSYPGQGYPGYPPPAGYPPPGYQGYGNYPATPPYASYAARAGGWLIDWVIVTVVTYLVAIPLDASNFASVHVHNSNGTTGHLSVAVPVVEILLVLLYGALFIGSRRGQTPGMMAVGARAVDRDTGAPIGFARALGRGAFEYLMAVVFFLPWILDMLWPAWDARRQTLHDKVTRTIVVKASMVPPAG